MHVFISSVRKQNECSLALWVCNKNTSLNSDGVWFISAFVLWRHDSKSNHCLYHAKCLCSPFWSFAPCLWAQTARGPWHLRSPALTPSVQLWLSTLTITWHQCQCTARSNRQACRHAYILHARVFTVDINYNNINNTWQMLLYKQTSRVP